MKKETALLILIIILKIILHYSLINPVYELHRDEYLHLDQAKHLAWGYYSVPPMTSWIAWLIFQLGGGEFWVKFFPGLFGILTILVIWETVKELKGSLFAFALSGIAILLSVLLRINILFQPNSFDILTWTFIYFSLIKYINTENNKWIYLGAIALALGFMNKYNIGFLVIGLLPAILLTRQRKIFLNPHFYYASGITIIIIFPNLLWQYQNDFPVLHHMNKLASTQLENVNRMDFIKEQVLFFIGSFFVIIAALISFFLHAPFKKFKAIFWSFLVTISVFIFLKAKGYYAIGLYPVLLAFGAVYLQRISAGKWKYIIRPLAILAPVIVFIPIAKLAFPRNEPQEIAGKPEAYKDLGLLRWEDGKDHALPQDFADMLGWKELADKVDKAFLLLPGKEKTLVLCDNYGQAGAINYYSKTKNINALSFNADYVNWFPDTLNYTHAILVKDIGDTDKYREKEKSLFKSIILFDSIQHPFAREKGTRIYILRNETGGVNNVLAKEIFSRKGEW
jgi:hypothetical protein